MGEVKVGSMYGTDYVQRLQESFRLMTVQVDGLEKKLDEKTNEVEELKKDLVEIMDVASDYNALRISEHLEAWEREREKNRKLKKRLRKCEEQLKKVDSISGTLEDMFKIRGE